MDLQTFSPRHDLLKKHIDFYYFLRTESNTFHSTYFSFPSSNTSLNIHKNIDFDIRQYATSVTGSAKENYVSLIQGMRESPLHVNLRGKLDKITIAFKPLGINHFIEHSYQRVAPLDSQEFTAWNENEEFIKTLKGFYGTDDVLERTNILEEFLLSIYMPFEKQELLERALSILSDLSRDISVEDIASELGMPVRTFNRTFKQHVGIAPVGFRNIIRFRHSLNNKLFNAELKKLTDIGNGSNFYDQSYFIRMYKKLTGLNPKKFFGAIEKLGDDKIVFQFVKK